jgi:hypothetical protein
VHNSFHFNLTVDLALDVKINTYETRKRKIEIKLYWKEKKVYPKLLI